MTSLRLAAAAGALAVGLIVGTVSADVLVLTDGSRLEGRITRQPDGGYVVTSADGTSATVPASRVTRVELTGGANEAVAADRLGSLRRAVNALNDIDEIIRRFERFAATNAGTAAGTEAAQELRAWQQRKAEGATKVGDRWLTPSARAAELQAVGGQIEAVREMLRTGRTQEAADALATVLAAMPNEVAALYLQGLILLQQDRIPQARKAFEAVNAQIADHAPTLNNLAVVQFRQNQQGQALSLFDQAMQAAPSDQTILDNIAEALELLDENDRARMPVARRVERRAAEQDEALQKQMAARGQYRWGATWVSREQLETLREAERQVQARVDQLKAEYERVGAQIRAAETEVERTQADMRRMEADAWVSVVDSDGKRRFIRAPLPQAYYDAQRFLNEAVARREDLVAQRTILRTQAKRVTQDLPVPKFTGTLRPIGEEGTPIEIAGGRGAPSPGEDAAPPARPATAPSGAPAPGA